MSTPKQSDELYQLEGKCSLRRVLPYPLQQILAMFVTNVTPLTIITSAAVSFLPHETVLNLIQGAMVAAGIATFVQATPIWKIGSGLPIFTGLSFTFVIPLSAIAAAYGYPAVIGGIMLMVLGQILVSGMEDDRKSRLYPAQPADCRSESLECDRFYRIHGSRYLVQFPDIHSDDLLTECSRGRIRDRNAAESVIAERDLRLRPIS